MSATHDAEGAMPTGLIRRGGRYSLRRRVPQDLVEHYGKAEIVRALGTSDPKEARRLLPKAWAAYDEQFDLVRRQQATPEAPTPQVLHLDPEEIAIASLDRIRKQRDEFYERGELADYVEVCWEAYEIIQEMLAGTRFPTMDSSLHRRTLGRDWATKTRG